MSIQILRGNGYTGNKGNTVLAPGQPYYDKANNLLFIGDDKGTKLSDLAPIKFKEPWRVYEVFCSDSAQLGLITDTFRFYLVVLSSQYFENGDFTPTSPTGETVFNKLVELCGNSASNVISVSGVFKNGEGKICNISDIDININTKTIKLTGFPSEGLTNTISTSVDISSDQLESNIGGKYTVNQKFTLFT